MATKSVVLFARVQPQMADDLDAIVAGSIGDRADHIRKALELYIEKHSPANDEAPQTILDSRASRSIPDDDGDPYPAYISLSDYRAKSRLCL